MQAERGSVRQKGCKPIFDSSILLTPEFQKSASHLSERRKCAFEPDWSLEFGSRWFAIHFCSFNENQKYPVCFVITINQLDSGKR